MDTENTNEEIDSLPDIDMEAATAEISSELFGQGEDEENVKVEAEGAGEKTASETATDQSDSPPVAEAEAGTEGENSQEVQAVGAPKTWTKEALEKWATIDPVVQSEILKREDDFLRGITQYKTAADVGHRYTKILEPYAPILAAENVDPDQMVQSFAANHYLLTKGTPQQKIELAAAMLNGYQIPLPELLNYMADNLPGEVDPRVASLERELAEIKGHFTSSQNAAQQAAQARIDQEIADFAADPAHPYFNELAEDISKLFGSGMASSLAEAYEKAVYLNPVTKQKEIDRITSERTSSSDAQAQARKDKIARSTADNVKLTPKSRDGTVPVGSLDDTLAETMAQIANRA